MNHTDLLDVASEKTTATPDIQFVASPYSEVQSLSTRASSNKPTNTEGEILMVFSEDEEEDLQGKLVKSTKGPQSRERKLSNEDQHMLPPRAKEGVILRPCSKFASTTKYSKQAETDQQPLKPMTILGFLQQSVSGNMQGNTKKRVEKAGYKSLQAFCITSSTGKTAASIPSFTLG